MRDVAVISFAQLPNVRHDYEREEVEMVHPVVVEAMQKAGLERSDIGFTVSGSSDYLLGRPFSFVTALDAVAPWPPIAESHLEMDGAWAMYEAWIRLQHGDIDSALVYAYGKSSLGDLPKVLNTQLDPYYLAPLGLDAVSLAALQARAMIDAGICTETQMADIAVNNRKNALDNHFAQLKGEFDRKSLLEQPYIANPLRRHDCPPISDGACAVILAAGDRAKALCEKPAWIRGIDHRVEAHSLGARNLIESRSTAIAAEKLGLANKDIDIAELHAPFTHQEILVKSALGLSDQTSINPSGGALAANPMMVAGLTRIGEVASRLSAGDGRCGIAHATSGPCLQQNLVCLMEVD